MEYSIKPKILGERRIIHYPQKRIIGLCVIIMKVILSRKGFDSSYGGYPSLILPNGQMVSLPIPSSKDNFTYSELWINNDTTYLECMKKISNKIRSKNMCVLSEKTKCHLDPDINRYVLKNRELEWRGCFGQAGAAQTVLDKHHVNEGDIFLFFGWFNTCSEKNGVLSFSKKEGFHAIYGYLQIDKKYYTATDEKIPMWIEYHPHMSEERRMRTNNCIYVARENASWNAELPGYGCFLYDKELRLSKEGMSRSKWNLPHFFQGLDIAYHSSHSWKEGYFQSACRGQEFVIEENDIVTEWAIELINRHQYFGGDK